MFPQAVSVLHFIVLMWGELLLEEFICKFAGLGEAIYALSNFDPYTSLVHLFSQVVFIYDMLGEDSYWYLHVFEPFHWYAKVFVFNIKTLYFAFFVLNMLFHNIFDVVMSTVLVFNSPG